jgi:enoyl-CoA hydratase
MDRIDGQAAATTTKHQLAIKTQQIRTKMALVSRMLCPAAKYFRSVSSLRPLCSLSQPPVVTELKDNIFHVRINRPDQRNCVNRQTANLLRDAFHEFDDRDDAAVAVLSGVGGNFCAGYDLSELSSSEDISDQIMPAPMGPSHMRTRKPVIAAVDGYAVAGGLELALLCDLRVVEENAVLGVFCRRFGVPLIDGGTVRLPAIIGMGRALDLILTGRAVSGKEVTLLTICDGLGES